MPLTIEHGVARDLFTYMSRSEHLDSMALVRVQATNAAYHHPNGAGVPDHPSVPHQRWFDVYVTTPLGPCGLRRIRAISCDDQNSAEQGGFHDTNDIVTHCSTIRRAIDVSPAFHSTDHGVVTLSWDRCGPPGMWPGPMPLSEPFTSIDEVSMDTVADLYARIRETATTESGPAGIAQSLLDQKIMTVESTAGDDTAQLTSRVIIALGSLGFIGGDVMRVSVSPSWVRLDTRLGTVLAQRRQRLNLLTLPKRTTPNTDEKARG